MCQMYYNMRIKICKRATSNVIRAADEMYTIWFCPACAVSSLVCVDSGKRRAMEISNRNREIHRQIAVVDRELDGVCCPLSVVLISVHRAAIGPHRASNDIIFGPRRGGEATDCKRFRR